MEKGNAKKIIQQIKEQKISPDPRWRLRLKSYIFWILLVVLTLLSAAFFSLALLSVVDFDLELMRQLELRRYIHLLMFSAPYVWLVMLILTSVLGFFIFRKTRKGYRYNVLFVASVILLVVSLLGVGAHMIKANDRMGRVFVDGPRGLHKLAPPGEERFFNPDEGIISGKIIEKKENFIKVENFNGEQWEVFYDEETRVGNKKIFEEKRPVIIIGEKIGERQFKAFGIKPMKRPRGDFFEEGKELRQGPAAGRAKRQLRK